MSAVLQGVVAALRVLLGVLSVAPVLIWLERRLLGVWQDRYGPNRVGPFGLLQPLADVIKILTKEDWVPPHSDRAVFVVAPAMVAAAALLAFAVVPIAPGTAVVDLDIGLLYLLAMAAMGVYGVVLGGWASNNKYSLLGALRAAGQMLTYEVFMGISLMGVVILTGSFRLEDIVEAQRGMWYCVPQAVGVVVFLVAGLAQTHRLPLDLPEAEAELTAGFHSEYSGMKFGMFFIGEYVTVTLIASMVVILFFGGWLGPAPVPPAAWFCVKTLVFVCVLILARGSLPRPRYDQLMAYGWKVLLPLCLLNLLVTGAVTLITSP